MKQTQQQTSALSEKISYYCNQNSIYSSMLMEMIQLSQQRLATSPSKNLNSSAKSKAKINSKNTN